MVSQEDETDPSTKIPKVTKVEGTDIQRGASTSTATMATKHGKKVTYCEEIALKFTWTFKYEGYMKSLTNQEQHISTINVYGDETSQDGNLPW